MGMKIEFAKSVSGHDAGCYYLIVKKDEKFVYLVNGTTKLLAAPKKKNKKHVQCILHVPKDVVSILDDIQTDVTIKRAVKMLERTQRAE